MSRPKFPGMSREDEEMRYAEYLICEKRGHQPSGYVTAGIPPKQTCKWCGTMFWHESPIQRESGRPQPQLTAEQEEALRSHGLAP